MTFPPYSLINMLGGLMAIAILTVTAVQGNRIGSIHHSWVGYCKVPHCEKSKNHTQCEQCEEGYYRENWECLPCTDIDSECVKCSEKDTCTECKEGFYESGGILRRVS